MFNYILESSKDDFKILNINDGSKSILLGSRYNEKENCRKFVDKINIKDGESIIIIIGIATGNYIDYLLSKLGYGNKLIILEPDHNIYNLYMELNRDSKTIKDRRLFIANYKNKNEVFKVLDEELDKSYIMNITYSVFTNYSKIYEEQLNGAIEGINEYSNLVKTLRNTNIRFSKKVTNNYFYNFKEVAKGINGNILKNTFKGKTAVIVSSGPSLSKNINELKKYQNEILIIAAARSLKELLINGIRPHFICALDPGDIMYNIMKESLNVDIPMITIEQTNYKLLMQYKGPKIFFLNSFKDTFSKLMKERYESLSTEGSVAHLATAFAAHLGVENIILVGQDLAFTDLKYHSEESSNNKLLNRDAFINKNELFTVEGNVEEKVFTNTRFIIFKNWFENFIKQNEKIKFINSTEGGAKIYGTEVMPLKNSIEKHAKELKELKELYIDIYENLINKSKVTTGVNEKLIKTFKDLLKDSYKGIEFSEKMISYYNGNMNLNIKYIEKTLDEIDDALNSNFEVCHLLNLSGYKKFEAIQLDENYREKIGETYKEAGVRLGKKSLEVYKVYVEIIEEIIEKINSTM